MTLTKTFHKLVIACNSSYLSVLTIELSWSSKLSIYRLIYSPILTNGRVGSDWQNKIADKSNDNKVESNPTESNLKVADTSFLHRVLGFNFRYSEELRHSGGTWDLVAGPLCQEEPVEVPRAAS